MPEGYVPSTIDESAQQQKWGSRIGGEHHGAELWHLYSTLAAPLASCCLLQRRRRLGCGSSECRWLTPAIYTSLAYEHKCLPSPSHTGLTLLSALAPSSPPREDQACPWGLCREPDGSARSDRLFQTGLFWILRVCAARSH